MMDSSYASSVLRISLDESTEKLEVVASMTVNDTNTSRVEAVRPDRSPIFPDPSRGRKYMMEFTANRSLVGVAGAEDHIDTQREISRMQLVWNGKSNYRKVRRCLVKDDCLRHNRLITMFLSFRCSRSSTWNRTAMALAICTRIACNVCQIHCVAGANLAITAYRESDQMPQVPVNRRSVT